MKILKKFLPDVLALLAFVVISVAYFLPAVGEGRILSQHDSLAGLGASQELTEYEARTGERTRWTNALFGGMPTYQIAPSYDSSDTFSQFVNIYRVEHAKRVMRRNPDKKIVDIYIESGFANEGSFFRTFKAVTGMTPKEWLSKA